MFAIHKYRSTACHHAITSGDKALHARCRKVCKFCDAPCNCRCHKEKSVTEQAEYDPTAANTATEEGAPPATWDPGKVTEEPEGAADASGTDPEDLENTDATPDAEDGDQAEVSQEPVNEDEVQA